MRITVENQALQRAIVEGGLTIQKLTDTARVSKGTIRRALRGEGILPSSYRRLNIALGGKLDDYAAVMD